MKSPSPTNVDQQGRITLHLLIRFLGGLSAYKLPTQAQFSRILLATLNSPIFDSSEPRPNLIQSVSRLLTLVRKLTDSKNQDDHIQRLLHVFLVKEPQIISAPTVPNIQIASPSRLLKTLVLTSLEIPKETIKTVENALHLLNGFFRNQTIQADQAAETSQRLLGRLVADLVKFLVNLHHNFASLLKDQTDSILKTLLDDFGSFEANDEFWEILNLCVECINNFFGTSSYWESLTAPCHELAELFTEHKEELLKPLRKLQAVVVNLFDDFDEQQYSPKLYDNLRSILEELKDLSALIAKPMGEILGTLEGMRLQVTEESQPWQELIEVFEQVLIDFNQSINFSRLPRQAAASAAKAAFHTLVEYLVPRLLLLLNEIPSPRIEFVSPTIDAVFDPASFTSTSGFLPSSIVSTTVLRVEISDTSSQNGATPTRQLNPAARLGVKPTTTKQKILIHGLRVMSKNVGFYFHKKVDPEKNLIAKQFDFTNFEDEGKLDVFLGMGTEDGLSLELELDWNHLDYHLLQQRHSSPQHQHSSNFNDGNRCLAQNKENPYGLFHVEHFKVDLKGFGIFPHETSHPIINWFLKPGLEPYLQSKIIDVLQEYILDQLSKLNNLLGKMRIGWEDAGAGGLSSWEKLKVMLELLNTLLNESEEVEQPTTSQFDGSGLTIQADDDSYTIRIGIGEKILPGKGLGGPGRLQQRLGILRDDVSTAIETCVADIADGIAQATIHAGRPGWQSDLFDLDA